MSSLFKRPLKIKPVKILVPVCVLESLLFGSYLFRAHVLLLDCVLWSAVLTTMLGLSVLTAVTTTLLSWLKSCVFFYCPLRPPVLHTASRVDCCVFCLPRPFGLCSSHLPYKCSYTRSLCLLIDKCSLASVTASTINRFLYSIVES